MKKFLTVLLALSVVFTYTVGTAFALPSDGTETAGLNAAKTQALTELNEQIDNISDYTEAGQLIITGKLADYTAQINAATTIKGVTSVLSTAKTDLTSAKNTYLKTAVADALTNALKQIKDYLYLFGYDVKATTITDGTADMTIKTAVITNGNVDLDSLGLSASDKASFTKEYTSQITKLKAAVSTDDVEESLNDVLKVIDKYLANLTSAEVTDAERTALVNEIISFARSKNVSTSKNYSSTIVNKYDAMVEEAVAAAKAVQTKAEYYEVINKYLGTEYKGKVVKSAVNVTGATVTVRPSTSGEDGYVVALDGSVYIFETTLGELNKLVNMNKDVEVQIKVAQKALDELGAYNYTDIAVNNWGDAEEIRAQLAYFVENGAWDGTTPAVTNTTAKQFASTLTSVTATSVSTSSQIKAVADQIVGYYDVLTKLYVAKDTAKKAIQNYYGTKLDGTAVTKITAYSQATQEKLNTLLQTYQQYIALAATEEAVDDYVAACKAEIEALKTIEEETIDANFAEVSKYIDSVVATAKDGQTLSADAETLIDRIVADLKDDIKTSATQWNKNGALYNWTTKTAAKKQTAVENLIVKDGNTLKADLASAVNVTKFQKGKLFGYTIAVGSGTTNPNSTFDYDTDDYLGSDAKHLTGYAKAVNEAAGKTGQTWADYLAVYDANVALCDAVETQAEKDYADRVKTAETKIAALGTVEDTSNFASRLAAATTAVNAVETAKLTGITADRDDISNIDTYDKAVYDLEYLKYTAKNGGSVAEPQVVKAYRDIALGITDADIIKAFSTADKQAILDIVTKAGKDLTAATTDAEKEAIATKAIADLKAFAPAYDNADYVEALAANKEEAVKYFNKYYNAAFTSDAASAAALIKDIIEFNEKLLPDESLEALKAEVKGTHMKIGSSAAKGYIKISWKASNTTVALDGVEVYRSTKKTSGFKKISTFKVQTSKKYTTNLTKGTKYYYYVKGYKMVGDEKVYTHNSITVGRTFR